MMRRSRAGEGGFVLAEILVVSVIVALLAAVAVPIYSGYVNSQRQDVAKNLAQAAAASANIFTRRTGAPPVCTHASNPTCVALLNIYLPDAAQFQVDIVVRTVKVKDLFHAGIEQSVNF